MVAALDDAESVLQRQISPRAIVERRSIITSDTYRSPLDANDRAGARSSVTRPRGDRRQ